MHQSTKAYEIVKALGAWKKERGGVVPTTDEMKARYPDADTELLIECYKAIGGQRAMG